jgi:tRNA G18 (ribose-2'-O)-methylase SpoU
MARLPLPDPYGLLRSAGTVAVLEDLVDHTNVGAVFRSAAGLGVDAVLVTPRCADPLYRRSVKVSMGAVFSVPWSRLESWPTDLSDVRRDGLTVLALTPAPDATPLADLPPSVTARCALLIGAEGPGLTQAALDAADHRVRIPMSGGVDSLNAAAAAAVAFYALAQSRR